MVYTPYYVGYIYVYIPYCSCRLVTIYPIVAVEANAGMTVHQCVQRDGATVAIVRVET